MSRQRLWPAHTWGYWDHNTVEIVTVVLAAVLLTPLVMLGSMLRVGARS
jgi:hypothetical protein